jgi:hypothetical protein
MTNLDPLSCLAIRYGTDKFGGHRYTPGYHQILQHLRDRPVRLLEIGVGGYESPQSGGASLRMWADYFPHGQITGLDLQPKNLPLPANACIVQGAQTDPGILQKLCDEHGPFDVIIDDGSHAPDDMMLSFAFLYQRMQQDGVYIVEDTQTCFVDHPKGDGTIYNLAYVLALQMHNKEGFKRAEGEVDLSHFAAVTTNVSFQRNFIYFQRGDNDYPSNSGMDLDHPAIAAIYQQITAEADANPAPRNRLSRLDMCLWAYRHDRARALVMDTLRDYPDDVALMHDMLFIVTAMHHYEMVTLLQLHIAALQK